MATVNIGGRDLRVLHVSEPGSFAVDIERARVAEEMAAAKTTVEQFRKLAENVYVQIRHNEGVTLEWVIDHLPADVGPIMRACALASGREIVAKEPGTGEAKAPGPRV